MQLTTNNSRGIQSHKTVNKYCVTIIAGLMLQNNDLLRTYNPAYDTWYMRYGFMDNMVYSTYIHDQGAL